MTSSSGFDHPLYQATLGRLGQRRRHSDVPSALRQLRTRSAQWLRQHGFPGPKDEAWRFTPLSEVTGVAYSPASAVLHGIDQAVVSSARLADAHAHSVLLVGGRVSAVEGLTAAGPQLRRLLEISPGELAALRPRLGADAGPATAFAAANDALFEDGLLVRVGAGVRANRPLQIVIVSAAHDRPAVDYPRLLVVAEAGSQLQLIETHVGSGEQPFLSNSVIQVHVGEGARIEHTRLELGSLHSRRVGLLDVQLQRNSSYLSRVVTLGGVFSRLDLRLWFDGEGAQADLSGLYLGRGSEQIDHHTVIDHAEPHCLSRESYRGIVDEQARAVFDGMINVRPGAQHTSAHQQSRNLVLSDQARVNTKPHLEIEADDVSCSHGASVGQLDAEAVFYLRSRGIAEDEARAMLAYGFVRESIDSIEPASLRELVREAVSARLPRQIAPGGRRS